MDERLSAYDLIVLPTTPIAAVPIASVEADEAEYDRVEGLLLRNCQVANQFDLTAITLPMPGPTRPAGLMLVGRNGTDGTRAGASVSRSDASYSAPVLLDAQGRCRLQLLHVSLNRIGFKDTA